MACGNNKVSGDDLASSPQPVRTLGDILFNRPEQPPREYPIAPDKVTMPDGTVQTGRYSQGSFTVKGVTGEAAKKDPAAAFEKLSRMDVVPDARPIDLFLDVDGNPTFDPMSHVHVIFHDGKDRADVVATVRDANGTHHPYKESVPAPTPRAVEKAIAAAQDALRAWSKG